MRTRSLRRRSVTVLAAALASIPHLASALETGLCTTGPYAVTCDWCTDPSSCHSARSIGTSSNGRVQHTEIVLLFWQDQSAAGYQWEPWSPNANAPSQSQLIGGVLSLVNSPYYASLWQYGPVVARPRMSPIAPIVTGAPDASPPGTTTASFQDTDLQYLVNQEIDAGLVPPPVANDNVLYVVLLPGTSPGTSTGSNAGCYHDGSGCNYLWGSYDGVPYTFAYVVADANATTYFSRETVDAITSFEDVTVDGCTYVNGGGRADQIADLCRCASERWTSGLALQAYWSIADNACVIPESWGQLSYDSTGKDGIWENTPYYVRQAYGGGHGVVFTDAKDDAWFFDSYNGEFTQIGGPGAEFAVGTASDGSGGAVVAGLTLDTTYGVNYYNAGSKQWYGIGAPNGPATSLTVTGQGIIVATDMYGQPWYYVPADRPHAKWTPFGGPGDQFLAVGNDVYALNVGRNDVFVWPWENFDAVGMWTNIRTNVSYMQIVGTPESRYWATAEPGEWSYWPSGNDFGQLVQAYDFAVTDIQPATFVAGGDNVQTLSTDVGSSWTVIGQHPVGRLISGDQIYATNCPGSSYPCVVLGD